MSVRSKVRRLGRWVGLAAIALLVMAAGARADGEWKIAEQTMTGLEAPEASIFATTNETFKLSVAWYASEIECSTLASEAPTKIFPGGTSEAILKLSSCQLLGPPFVAETCELIEPIELKVAGKLILQSGKTYELYEAQSGKPSLGTIKFKEGTECPLPLSNELKGTFVGETEAGERVEQPRTFNPTIESLFGSDSLSFDTHPATLKGKSTWALAAGYKGLKWAAESKEGTAEEEAKLKAEEEAKLKEEKELEEAELKEKEELKLIEEEEKKLEEAKLEEEMALELLDEEWTLLRNGVLVSSLILIAEVEEGELLVPELGLAIHCEGGEGAMHVETAEAGKKLLASAEPEFHGCTDLNFGEVCTVQGKGDPVGTIGAAGTATGSTKGGKVFLTAESSPEAPFADIVYGGEECPLVEINSRTFGFIELEILNPVVDTTLKQVHISDQELELGSSPAELHMLDPETEEPLSISGSITEASEATFAIH